MWKTRPKALFAILAVALFAGCVTDGVDTPSWFPSPDKPDGPDTVKVGAKVEFETEGTDPADVHEFQWDFGDGKLSDWDDDYEEIKYRFAAPGTFEVKVRERCPLRLFQSDWSKGHKITVKHLKEKE